MPAFLTGREHRPAMADDLYVTALMDGPLPLHPPVTGEKSGLIDQAYSEFRHLREAGVEVDPDAFCARFPACESSLRKQVEVHLELEANPDLLRKLERWPAPGQEFFGFKMEEELGRGAFARVFLAREPDVGNRQVVVKVSLHADDEADTLGKLRHPNVVPIHSARYDHQTEFSIVCMPFLGGTTLLPLIDKLCGRKARPDRADMILKAARDDRWPADSAAPPARVFRRGSYLEGVLYMGERLANALAYVHERGVLHRDLKPSNILICPNGEPVLIDFNLAHDRSMSEYRLGGTLPYMPPEQLKAMAGHRAGDPVPADNRSDLFALGVILYEMLTGAHPFGPVPLKLRTAAAREFLLNQQKKGPRPLRFYDRDIDPAVDALIVRCLGNDPASRPGTARELAAELRRLPSWRWRARRWTAANAKAVAVGVMLVGTSGVAAAGYVANLPTHAQKAEQLYKAGDYKEALEEFDFALDSNDSQPALHFARARALMKLGDFGEAIRAFAKADQDGRTSACIGYCNAMDNFASTAVPFFEKAIKQGTANAAVLNDYAMCLHRNSRFEEAEAATTDALDRSPGFTAAFYNRGLARYSLWKQTHQPVHALGGLEDLREALNQGVATPNGYFFASTLCAAVLNDRLGNPKDDPLFAEGERYLRLAVEHGHPRNELSNCCKFVPCRSAWAEDLPLDLKVQAASKDMDNHIRLVDPISD
ncbi:MAG TPA: serine/threonine-protein kinase [Gemmataceae bacterium]|jgi:serine/threonine protein kinase|nr:serine/threonine-protein kinase [Gemmataceae bacterium]